MKKNVSETPYSQMWIDDGGILHIRYTKKTDVTLIIAKKEIELINKICLGKKIPTLVNLNNTKSISREARQFLSGRESQKVLRSVALVVKSPIHSVMGNFFLGINKPSYPLKLFSSEEQALNWLKTL